MTSDDTYIILFLIIIALTVIAIRYGNEQEKKRDALMTPEEKQKLLEEEQLRLAKWKERELEIKYGAINTAMICPHCQVKGKVHTKSVKLKKGLSGAKATGAVLTGGLSILAVGLSRKEDNTQAHCDNCNSTWIF